MPFLGIDITYKAIEGMFVTATTTAQLPLFVHRNKPGSLTISCDVMASVGQDKDDFKYTESELKNTAKTLIYGTSS